MKNTILKFNRDKCTGCGACINICPCHALIMQSNNEGFFYPSLSKGLCVQCGKCMEVCPIDKDLSIINPSIVAVCQSTNDDFVDHTSSGGIFGELADGVLKKNGIVCGAVFDSKNCSVVHGFSTEYPLAEILRSKYVQSDTGDSFKIIKDVLNKGKIVLYCGTPCQVNGLLKFLGGEKDNLITIDFICHGVPSPGVFKDVIAYYEKKYNKKVKKVTFREKDKGWRKQVIKFYFSDGQIRLFDSKYFFWYNLFLGNYTIRTSCVECNLWNTHQSDLTLGDAWSYSDSSHNAQRGVSIVFCNTIKGQTIFNRLVENKKVYVYKFKSDETYSQKYSHNYGYQERRKFFNQYSREGFSRKKCEWFNLKIIAYRVLRHFI